MSDWYAVLCRPRREALAETNLVVLLEFLGKLNKVKVDRDWLVPAA